MKYFIIAGEQSGDLHGSNLIRGIVNSDSKAEIVCWGGDLMEGAGAKLLVHYRKLAFMGFVAVLKNLGAISQNLKLCSQQIVDYNPDVVIFIDYGGFNMRMARFAKEAGFTTFYYISPKFWAWNEGRVKKVKKYIDRMFIIFPFEVDFYKKYGIEVSYHGNPVVDEIERKRSAFASGDKLKNSIGTDGRPVIALLAGSRKHEIEFVLPQMVKIVNHFPEYQFVLAGVKNMSDDVYNRIIGDQPVRLVKERTYEILFTAEAALVTSGTATLETAIIGTPQVVCYKADFFSILIAWIVIRVKYISLVNLILGYEAVRELKQYDLNERNLLKELKDIVPGGKKRDQMLSDYNLLKSKLGPAGASFRIAAEMVKELEMRGNTELHRG